MEIPEISRNASLNNQIISGEATLKHPQDVQFNNEDFGGLLQLQRNWSAEWSKANMPKEGNY